MSHPVGKAGKAASTHGVHPARQPHSGEDPPPKGANNWRAQLEVRLGTPGMDRVLPYTRLYTLAREVRSSLSAVTLRAAIDDFLYTRKLQRVGNGLYLNRCVQPPATPIEATHFLRHGSVVSLHSVLGESGVLNNPSLIVTAVSPSTGSTRGNGNAIMTEGRYSYRFYNLHERFFPPLAGDVYDVLNPAKPYPSMRPEKALLDWIHLGNSSASKMTLPPVDIDLDMLDRRRLHDLAKNLDMTDALRAFLDHAHRMGYGAEDFSAARPRRMRP